MLAVLGIVAALLPQAAIERDAYGVPHISAPTLEEAYRLAGRAVAQDRLWQMEMSRRLARGRAAEVMGKEFAAADREVLSTGYTDEEMQGQFDLMSPLARRIYTAYVQGVNDHIEAGAASGLPEGYARYGFKPEPWTVLDSVAISINLWSRFGRGGAGEIRNLALYRYLQSQPCKDRALDVLDDLLPENDPDATPTVAPAEDPLASTHPAFPARDRATTERHLAMLPPSSLFELLPGLRLAQRDEGSRVAQMVGAPFQFGSYAVVVGPKRSRAGLPILLSAPQMGFSEPSVVHEMSIRCPEMETAGMDVPGVPGVLIGTTPYAAWGLTSGIADTDDIFVFEADGEDKFKFAGQSLLQLKIERKLKVKGEADQTVVQRRTNWGPVVVATKTSLYVRRNTSWGIDMRNYEELLRVQRARTWQELSRPSDLARASFNAFFATVDGHIGWRYMGRIPIRSTEIDPRFPVPGDPKYDWKGYIPASQMPHVLDPAGGLIANWNNKPAAWWPHTDTPTWTRLFRIDALREALTGERLGVREVEMAAWQIARRDVASDYFYSAPAFGPAFRDALAPRSFQGAAGAALPFLLAYDGWALDGSNTVPIYRATLDALREDLFVRHIGNLLQPDLFRLAIQPTIIHNALLGKTKFDYLAGRTPNDVVAGAYARAAEQLAKARGSDPATWTHVADAIRVDGQAPIPYRNRGTYIQVVELAGVPRGRNVLPPGVAESGPHRQDQVPLSRAWTFKPMRRLGG